MKYVNKPLNACGDLLSYEIAPAFVKICQLEAYSWARVLITNGCHGQSHCVNPLNKLGQPSKQVLHHNFKQETHGPMMDRWSYPWTDGPTHGRISSCEFVKMGLKRSGIGTLV